MTRNPDLGALIGSRICHDLISPLGAIGNGVELLSMSAPQSPEMTLVLQSVENANARIRFFRIAYGAPAPQQRLGRSDIVTALAAAVGGGRLSLFWQAEGDQPRDEVRIAFLLLQCLESALPHGGEIEIGRRGAGWVVTAASERLRVEPELWDALTTPETLPQLAAAQVQFALLPIALEQAGRSLEIDRAADRVTARF